MTEKTKIDWEQVETIDSGSTQSSINRALTAKGPIYSFFFSRVFVTKDGDVKTNKFFRPGDISSLENLLKEVDIWIECDRDEQKQLRNNNKRKGK